MSGTTPDLSTTGGPALAPPTVAITSLPEGGRAFTFVLQAGTNASTHVRLIEPSAISSSDPMPEADDLKQDIREIRADLKQLTTRVSEGFTRLDDKRHDQTRWLLCTYGAGVLLLLGVIAKGFKWI